MADDYEQRVLQHGARMIETLQQLMKEIVRTLERPATPTLVPSGSGTRPARRV